MKEKRAKIKISTKLVKRSYVAFALIIAVFALLAYRILTIQTVNFDYYQQKVINQLTTESTIYSRRGVIYDSEGAQLAEFSLRRQTYAPRCPNQRERTQRTTTILSRAGSRISSAKNTA